MSKAYKCDRCGCYFDSKNPTLFGVIMVKADFCPECVRSFEKWVKMDDAESEDKG